MAAILLYHSVADPVVDDQLQISPHTLLRHLDWCLELGHEIVPVPDALARSAGRRVGVSFDDGFASILTVWPLLAARGICPSVFVCPGRVGGENAWASAGRVRERLLDVEEIRWLADQGVMFGNHGWDHRAFMGRSAVDLAADLARSQAWFEAILGAPAIGFAWPYGRFDAEALEVVEQVHAHALAVEPAWGEEASPLTIPRVVAREGMSACEFEDELMLKSFVMESRVAAHPSGHVSPARHITPR
jgi:peptidoglycan/xylan/chitin deacetylase (PgdA/CDA1 family)